MRTLGITLLLNISSTTEPIRRRIGSVVELTFNTGLQRFESRGNDAITKELSQLHTMDCFHPRDAHTLSREDRRNALTSLMFFTEKCSGEIKAQACANGSVQQHHVAKEEAAAPTVTSEAIFIQSTIFAHENRDVAEEEQYWW